MAGGSTEGSRKLSSSDHGLTIETVQLGDELRLRLSGELDIASAPLLDRTLLGTETIELRSVALDLRELRFIDSSGLRAILSEQERCEQSGRRLTVITGSQRIRRLFDITNVGDRVDLRSGEEDEAPSVEPPV